MTLNQLKYAIIVAESESFNEAAKKLFISQPSLSTSIHSLEEEIGVQIFRRSQNGIAVTPDGKEFIGYARQVMEQYELLDARYITKSEVKKRFSVSMQHYSFAVNAFVHMVKQYGMDEYEFAVHETKTHEVIEDVKNGKSEIGILYINSFNKNVLEKIFNDRATMLNLMVGLNGYTLCSGIICEELNGDEYCAVKLDAKEVMDIGYISRKGIALSTIGQQYLEEISKYKAL